MPQITSLVGTDGFERCGWSRRRNSRGRKAVALLISASAAASLLGARPTSAANLFWDGTGTGWDSTSSWSTNDSVLLPDPATVPGSADLAYFNISAVNTPQTVSLNGAQSALGLVFVSTGTETLQGGSGNSTLTVGASGINVNAGAGAVTIGSATAGQNVPISLGASQTWVNAGFLSTSATLTVNNGASAASASTLTLDGGSGSSTSTNIINGNLTGGLSVVKNGIGTWAVSGTGDTYTGSTTLNGGTLYLRNTTANVTNTSPLGTGTLFLNGGTLSNAGNASNGAETLANSGITLGANTTTTIDLAVQANITLPALSGSGNLLHSGAGTFSLFLNGDDSGFTGNFTATSLVTRFNAASGGSAAASWNFNNSTGNVASLGGSTGTYHFGALNGTGTFVGSNGVTVEVGELNQNSTYTGTLFNATNTALIKAGTGVFTVTASSTYTGATTIQGGTLATTALALGGAGSGIGSSSNAAANLVLDGGVLSYTGTAVATTDRLFTLTANGGGLDASGSAANTVTFSNTGSITLAGTTARTFTLSGSNTGNNTLAPILADASAGATSLTKVGAGTWVLSGANTYTGATTVVGGTLSVSGSLSSSSPLAFAGTGAFNFAPTSGGSQSLAGVSFAAGDGTVQSTFGTPGTTLTFTTFTRSAGATANFVASGGTNGSTNSIVLTGPTGGFIDQGTFFGGSNYAFYDTTTPPGFVRGINYATDPNAQTVAGGTSISSTNGAFVQTTAAVTAQTLDTFNTLNISGASNFTLATGATLTLANGGLLKSGGGASTLSGGTALQAGATGTAAELVVRTDAAGDSLTISTPVTNNGAAVGALTKSGAGTLALTGANTYTGPTTVNAGVLSTTLLAPGGSNSGLGASAATASNLVLNGGALQYNGAVAVTTNRLFSVGLAGGALDASGVSNVALTLSGTGSIGFNGQSGPRTLTLTGASTGGYNATAGTGPTGGNVLAATIADGGGPTSLVKSGAGAWVLTANNTYTGGTTISAGSLQVGNNTSTGSLGTGPVVDNGTLTFNFSTDQTVSNLISGTGALVKGNAGTTGENVTLTGFNSFAGNVTVNNGLLTITNSNSLGTGTKTIALTNGTAGNPQLHLNGSGINLPAAFSFSTSNAPAGAGAVVNDTGYNSIAGNFTLNSGGGATAIASNAGFLTLSGSFTPGATGRTLNLRGNGGGAITGVIADGTGQNALTGVLKDSGTGAWTLSGTNTYSGPTSVTAGTLVITKDASLGAAYTGGVLKIPVIGGGTGYSAAPQVNFAGGGGSGAAATATVSGGVITAITITNPGTGYLSNPTVTFTGATFTTAATATALVPSLTLGATGSNGTLQTAGAITTNRPVALTSGTTDTIDTDGFASTFSGVLNGAGGLNVTGNGTLSLTGANTYTGATTVNAGRLLVGTATSGSLTATSGVTVNAPGVLGGSGSIAAPATLNAGATLSPGNNAPGILSVKSLTLAATPSPATYAVYINGSDNTNPAAPQYGQTVYAPTAASGTASVNGAVLAINDLASTANVNAQLWIIDGGPGSSAVSGTFLVPQGSTLVSVADGQTFTGPSGAVYQINYNALGDPLGTNHDVVLTVVSTPEPGSLAILGLGAAGLLVRRRRVLARP